MLGRQLLDFTLDARLRRVLDEDVRAQQDILAQFGLAGAIASNRIDVRAGADMIVRQDRRILLVGGHGGDDIGTLDGLFHGRALRDGEAETCEVLRAFAGCGRVDVVEAQLVHAEQRLEGAGLEFALCAIADDRHGAGVRPRQVFRRDSRGRRRAQCRQDRHFRQQHRITVADIRQHAKGRHGLPAVARVLRVAVDIFEAVERPVARRHQLDDAFLGVRRDARGLVEDRPAAEVLFDGRGQLRQEPVDADLQHQLHHMVDADERHDVQFRISVHFPSSQEQLFSPRASGDPSPACPSGWQRDRQAAWRSCRARRGTD